MYRFDEFLSSLFWQKIFLCKRSIASFGCSILLLWMQILFVWNEKIWSIILVLFLWHISIWNIFLALPLLQLVVILSSSVKLVLLYFLFLVVGCCVAGPLLSLHFWWAFLFLEGLVRLSSWWGCLGDVTLLIQVHFGYFGWLTLLYVFVLLLLLLHSAIFESEFVSVSDGWQAVIHFVHTTRVTGVVPWHVAALVVGVVDRGSVWTHLSHIWVHVVRNMWFVLLSLIFQLSCHLFSKNWHVLLHSLFHLLLN